MAITYEILRIEATTDGSGDVSLAVHALDGETVIRHQNITVSAEAALLVAESAKTSTDLENLIIENAPPEFSREALAAVVAANEAAQSAAGKLSVALAAAFSGGDVMTGGE